MSDEGATAEGSDDVSEDLSALMSSATLMLFLGSLGSLSRLVEQVAMGRLLSPDAYGEVSIAFSMMTITTTLALGGFMQGISRFMTRFEDPTEIRGAWVTGAAIGIAITAIATVVLGLNIDLLAERLFDASTPRDLVIAFVAMIPFFAGLKIAVAGIRGRENTIYRTYTQDLLYNGLRLALVIGLLLAGYGVAAMGYAYLISAAVAFVAALWLFNRLFPITGEFNTRTREIVLFSLPLTLSSVTSILLSEIDTVMLGYYLPSSQAGIYNAARPLSRGVSVIVSSFGFLFLPLMSRLDAGGRYEEVNRMYKVTTKWVYVVTFPAVLCLFVFTDDLLFAVFGAEYTAGAIALKALVIGSYLTASFGRCQDTLSAFGYTTYIFVINAIAGVLNICLNALLIGGYGPVPNFGIEGAAAATAVSSITLNGLALAVLWRRSGVNPFSRQTIRTFLLLPVALGPPALFIATQTTLSLPILILFVVIAGIVSIALLALTGSLQAEDEIPFELIEDKIGITIPLIRRYIPDSDD